MAKKTIKQSLRALEHALDQEFAKIAPSIMRNLEKRLSELRGAEGGLRGMRGKLVRRALRRLELAVDRAHRETNSPQVRKAARKVVRAAASEGLEELDRRLSRLRGLQLRTTRQANRKANLVELNRLEVGRGLSVVHLDKADRLEDAGARLGVCVANRRKHDARPYFERLEEGTCTYFLLEGPDRAPLALMEVDDGRIDEIAGPRNEEFELPAGREGRELAFDILDRLGGVTAYGIDAFRACGAPCLTLRNLPAPMRMEIGERTLLVAAVQGKSGMVVVKDADGVWSYFSGDGEGVWDSDGYGWNALGVGELVQLMLRFPELVPYEFANDGVTRPVTGASVKFLDQIIGQRDVDSHGKQE